MLNFPDAPTPGQRHLSYIFDGVKWLTSHITYVSEPPSNNPMSMDGVASAGASVYYARGDHRHPTDVSRAPINNANFTGTLTAALLNVTTVNATGKLTSTSKGHMFGWARGTAASGAVTKADANIKLYDHGSDSWCGVGTDSSGNIWVRTGYAGNPAPIFYVTNDQTVVFRDSLYGPTPGAGDNSTRLATTAFVKARAPAAGVPLAGGTVSGNLTHHNVDLWVHQNNNYGVIYLGNTGARYLQWTGAEYNFNGASVFAGNGRLWGTADWGSAPYNNARLAYVADRAHPGTEGLAEPYGGSTITGSNGHDGSKVGVLTCRYRQFQYYTTGWFAIGYA
jgi:hypothetical protein